MRGREKRQKSERRERIYNSLRGKQRDERVKEERIEKIYEGVPKEMKK